jgi:hypothetical protein
VEQEYLGMSIQWYTEHQYSQSALRMSQTDWNELNKLEMASSMKGPLRHAVVCSSHEPYNIALQRMYSKRPRTG